MNIMNMEEHFTKKEMEAIRSQGGIDKLIEKLGLDLDERGNVRANDFDYKTNQKKIFVSGDMRRGQSLVVWAIREGRQVAHSVDKFLMGKTNLPY